MSDTGEMSDLRTDATGTYHRLTALLDEMDALGVRLWAEAGQLRFQAPVGVLSDQHRQQLKAVRTELIALLEQQVVTATPDPDNAFQPFPLTDVQEAYLVGRGDAFEYGGVGCHGYVELQLPRLDPQRMSLAWLALIKRHPMLHARISQEGVQQVMEHWQAPTVQQHDLRGLCDQAFACQLAEIRSEMAAKVYAPDSWPLYELRLSQADEGGMLHLSIDLLIADFISIQLLLQELDYLYHKPDQPLPALGIGFRELVLAERAAKDSVAGQARYERDRRYWLQRMPQLPPAPELPLRDNPISRGQTEFVRHQCVLAAGPWQALQKLARQHRLTPSGLILAVFSQVLRRWSRNDAFCLNVTVLNRPALHPDVNRVVGDFTRVNVLEVAAPGTEHTGCFATQAQALQQQLLGDLEHGSFSGVELLREMARTPEHRGRIIPYVFTSTLGVGNDEGGSQFMTDATLSYGISQTPQVWLDCQVSELDGELRLNWDVRDGVFMPGMVEEAFAALEQLLVQLIDPGHWHQPEVVPLPASMQQQRQQVNNTAAPLPQTMLHQGFIDQLQQRPDATAIAMAAQQCSYAELADRAAAVADRLQQAGLQPAQPVAVCLAKSIDQIAAVLGVMLAGGAYLPLAVEQPQLRQQMILDDAGCQLLLIGHEDATAEGQAVWPDSLGVCRVDRLSPLPFVAERWQQPDWQPQRLAYTIFTSGTTGRPKGVMISHQAALNTLVDVNRRINLGPGDAVLGLASLNFDLSVYDIFATLAAGATLVLPDADQHNNPAHWLSLIAQHRVSVWNSVPAQLQMLHSALQGADDLCIAASLRVAMMSGDWIPVTLPQQIRQYLPHLQLISMGGATEAAVWSIWHPINVVPAGARSIPYGRPMDNQRFHVLDGRLEACPDWVPGELYIAGDGLALGYMNDPQRSAERFITHPRSGERLYRTGDMGRYRPDGVIEFLGRDDTQIKLRGHRIELSEIESVLQGHPAVAMAVAVMAEDGQGEKRLAAFVEAACRSKPVSDDGADWAAVITQAGDNASASVDRARFADWVRCADQIALMDIMATLQGAGLFTRQNNRYSLAQVISATMTVEGHRRLLQRWLSALCREGWLAEPEKHCYQLQRNYDPQQHQMLWQQLQVLEAEVNYGAELLRYLRESAAELPRLLTGEVDPLALLFPQGGMETAFAAYNDNLVNRTMNAVAVAAAVETAQQHQRRHPGSARPLQVLEIGAGVGGTSSELIPALADFPVRYQFTDLSTYFLNEARERYSAYPWVEYGLFDLNQPGWQQGQPDRSLDMIVCANVLHNSTHAPTVLQQLRQMAAPGATLIVIEATREIYSLLTSMEFKQGLEGFTDLRQHTGQTFITRDQWQQLFSDAGLELLGGYPTLDDPMSQAGQTTFVVRVPDDRQPLSALELQPWLAQRLPDYMLPGLEVVEQIPLSANGKVDRKQLVERVSWQRNETVQQGDGAVTPLEQAIAGLWAQALGLPQLGRNEDFFMAGGDSLLIAQVVSKMREQLPEASRWSWDRLMREMLSTPTVAQIATLLECAAWAEEGGDNRLVSPLVELRAVTDPAQSGTCYLLVHDGSGTLAPYRQLIAALELAAGDRVLGFTLVDNDSFLARDSASLIETLGAEYAALVPRDEHLQVQLIGYCMGGLIATEIARNLLEQGVECLCQVISSDRFHYQVDEPLLLERAFARLLGADLAQAGHTVSDAQLAPLLSQLCQQHNDCIPQYALQQSDLSEVAACYQQLAQLGQSQRLQKIAAAMADSAEHSWDQPQIDSLYQVFCHSLQAVAQYQPLPYIGQLQVLMDDQSLHFLPGMAARMSEFWDQLSLSSATRHSIGGDHLSCMTAPHLQQWLNLLEGQSHG